jgi:4-alpha-glucanotransferase
LAPDYALYMALRQAMPQERWPEWPRALRRREPAEPARARRELSSEMAYYEFEQPLFDEQWRRLRAHGRARGVGLIGDAPIFIAHESADVWSHPGLFLLDRAGEPTHVAGVPPDYFSRTGQRWGNPLYRWRRSDGGERHVAARARAGAVSDGARRARRASLHRGGFGRTLPAVARGTGSGASAAAP